MKKLFEETYIKLKKKSYVMLVFHIIHFFM